jgi:poly(hydroxyalkanoate) depolymerase family esterase
MFKGLNRLLLREMTRAGKAQLRQAARLTAKALAKKKPTKQAAKRPTKQPAERPAATTATPPLPGKWLASYYSHLTADSTLPLQRMQYYLYLPSHFPAPTGVRQEADQVWPLVIMLHGCGQTAAQFAQGTRMNQLAEQKGYAVLYPQQSLRTHPNRCWKWYDKATQAGGGDTLTLVGMIAQIIEKYPIDTTRIYLGGISAGAAMANIVALNHPNLIAALGLHSAPVFGAGNTAIGALGVMQHGASNRIDGAIMEVLQKYPNFPALPTILIQGQSDQIVRPVNQAQLEQQALQINHLGADSPVQVIRKPAGRNGRNPGHAYEIRDFRLRKKLLLRVTRVEHLDHAWSGGDARLAFNAAAGPDASKMMLDFFARHRR